MDSATTQLQDEVEPFTAVHFSQGPSLVQELIDCSHYGHPNFTEVLHPSRGSSAVLIALLIVVPNALVILITSSSLLPALLKSRPVSVHKILILILACTDFTFGFTDILPQALRYLRGFCRSGGMPVCVAQGFVSNVLLTMSVVLVILMSAERLSALRFPFHHHTIFSLTNTLKIIAALIFYSAFISVFPLLGVNEFVNGQFGCDFQWADTRPLASSYVYFRAINGLLLLITIVVLNAASCAEVIKMQSMIHPAGGAGGHGSSGGETENEDKDLQNRFMVLVILTSIASVVCNTPYSIRLIQFQLQMENPAVPTFIVKRMFLSNSIVNPLLMIIFYVSTYASRIHRMLKKRRADALTSRDNA